MTSAVIDPCLELEIDLLLQAVHETHGLDFRHYCRGWVVRRVLGLVAAEGLRSVSGLQERVLHDPGGMQRLLVAFASPVTSMFRDPPFFHTFRRDIVPLLRTYPHLRLWLAGCSSGEEVYSLAILLEEENLYDRSRIYATDINENALAEARAGVFPLARMRQNTANYLQAGGRGTFSQYYRADRGRAVFDAKLQRNLVFSSHNLATDASFNEFHVIWCRNVLIYFDRNLKERVHGLLYDSLGRFGVLGLGDRETLDFTPRATCYRKVHGREKLYRKVM